MSGDIGDYGYCLMCEELVYVDDLVVERDTEMAPGDIDEIGVDVEGICWDCDPGYESLEILGLV